MSAHNQSLEPDDGPLPPDAIEVPPGEWEDAVLGREISAFWDSKIGQYLLKRSLEEYNAGITGLLKCDPTDLKSIAKHQSAALRAESFRDWLSAAIADGLRAENILEQGN